jgi:P4 family phage/plasmid primase-like protien
MNTNTEYDSEIEENSVENKIIHEHKKNSNILNRLYNNNNEKYKQLTDYLLDYKLTKESKQDSNITIPGEARYYIPEHKQYRFFEKLKECAKENLILHFCERQHSDFHDNIGSGIMFDFDLLQESDKNTLHEKPFDEFIKKIFLVMKELIKYDDEIETYAAVITKKKLVYKEEYKLYKNGFHILIPGIKLTREAKKLIYNKIIENDDIKKFFNKTFDNKLGEVFDKGSYSVPVYYMYNCKNSSNNPYDLFNIYKINISDYVSINTVNKERILNTYNIIIELSLNHPGDLINKKFYKLKDEYQLKIANDLEKSKVFIDKLDKLNYSFDTENTYIDENLEYYNKLVIEILDDKRANDRNMWRDVIYALANINPGNPSIFKNIAERFSMRCEYKYDEVAFHKLWEEAINYTGNNKFNLGSLIRWAKEDNLKKYNRLSEKNIIQTIKYDVFESDNKVLNGSLFQYHFAYYIYHLFKEKFVCDIGNGKITWFEFVLDKDSHIKGEVFKWREEIKPDNLYKYISSKLPNKISTVIKEAEDYTKNHPDNTNINEFLQHRIQKLRTSSQKLYTTEFKKGILKEAEVLFRKRGFIQGINGDQNILGVGNGVLELSENPKLIRHYHDYPITLFTDIDYIQYDSNNPFIQTVLDGIYNLFPEDEKDAFHYIMYYLASCLDGKPKDSMILIITGQGSNGKSFLAEMIKSVLGTYGKKMPLSFLTDSRGKASGADPSLMDLKIARLAYYSESNKHEVLNTAKLKEVTSQETLSGRGLYEKQSQFRPVCHHMVTTNYNFSIKTTDHGIWRRIVTYEFKMLFTPNPDPTNKYEKKENTKFAQEFTYNPEIKKAFLSILVEYYKDLHKNHGGSLKNIMKPTIDKETTEYRNKEDVINRFIDDVCIYSPGNKTCISELIDKYENWYEYNVDKSTIPIKSEIHKQLLNSKLIKYVEKTQSNIILKNIRIKEDSFDDDILSENEYFIKDIINNSISVTKTKYDISQFNPLNIN